MSKALTWLFATALRLAREVNISWQMAKAEVTPLGSTPGLCACGWALDDHIDGDCPDELTDEEFWAVMLDDEEDEDEEE